MNILGVNAYHGDSAAALVQDGRLVAAVEEERFNRVKHWAGFPAESIRFCLRQGGIAAKDLDHVAISFNPRANLAHKAAFMFRYRPSLAAIVERAKRQSKAAGIRPRLADACGVPAAEIRARVHHVEHHSAHVASAFDVSPFARAAILSIDGMGDFVSTLLASGQGNRLKSYSRVYFPHSLGMLYNALTLFLGFPAYGDEYKVMGLACYGKPAYVDALRTIIAPRGDGFQLNLEYFTHHARGVSMSWDGGAPVVLPFHSRKLERLFGPPRDPRADLTERDQDLACSLQVVTEEIVFHVLNRLYRHFPCENLCLAGGVAMNSVANGRITEETPFRNVYVPAGAADNGTAFGSAFYVWNQVLGRPRSFVMTDACLGNEYTADECREAIRINGLEGTRLRRQDLLNRVVDALCAGKVVGWFQGRMEFGARALGNRSLLADPRRADMRDIINLKIKFREKFRPFAPSVLEEHVGTFFEIDAPAPFMEKVFRIRPERRAAIPAVTHFDGTGRLQTVSRETNPLYWDLIKTFADRTGVPILLNTSLNENEPIVNTPDQALKCMLRTRMDAMVLGPYYVERSAAALAKAA
jgi:carbamoyltransferase